MSTDTAPRRDPGAEVGPSVGHSIGPGVGPGVGHSIGPGAGASSWLLEQRGSFVVGRCDGCGFTTSARRARFSVESDMQTHAAGCGGRPGHDADGEVAATSGLGG